MAAQRVIDRLVRQWRILEALQSRRRGMTAAQLEEALSVSHATLYRDLRVLVESPLPLRKQVVNGETRYLLDAKAWPSLPLSPRALLGLSVARELLRPLEGTSLVKEIDRYLGASGRRKRAPVEVAGAAKQQPASLVGTLERAIEERRRCRLLYQSAREPTPRWRVVEPVGLRLHDEALYAAMWDVKRAAWRVYKAARLHAVELLSETCSAHPPCDLAELFAHSAGVWSGQAVDVEVLVDGEKARFAGEYPLVDDQVLVPQPDGGVVVRARVAGTVEAAAWVLGWGRHATAMAPPELVRAVASELRAAAARYPDGSSHPR